MRPYRARIEGSGAVTQGEPWALTVGAFSAVEGAHAMGGRDVGRIVPGAYRGRRGVSGQFPLGIRIFPKANVLSY